MNHRRVMLAATVVGLAVATGGVVAAVTLPASAASTGCMATYTVVSQWPGGFQAGVSFTNLGDPISSWTLGFTFPDANQKETQGWNATWSQSGAKVSAASMSWNGSVGTNASVSLRLIGSYTAPHPAAAAVSPHRGGSTGGVRSPSSDPPLAPPRAPPPR